MDAWAQVVLAVLAFGGPLLGYLIQLRKASGRITSSDAAELWAESRDLRHGLDERIKILEEQLRWEREHVVKLIEENNRLLREAAGDI